MNAPALSKREIIDTINNLPSEILPEMASYLDYLKFKMASPVQAEKPTSGNSFMLSIAGMFSSEESDTSEHVQEIVSDYMAKKRSVDRDAGRGC